MEPFVTEKTEIISAADIFSFMHYDYFENGFDKKENNYNTKRKAWRRQRSHRLCMWWIMNRKYV